MPIDPFAALNALLRAEAARADEPEIPRRPACDDTDSAAVPGTVPDHGASDGERNESRTPR
jgi:hypothetical protein